MGRQLNERSLLACATAAAVCLIAPGEVSAHRDGQTSTWRAATGNITHIGLSRVSVGRLTCLAPSGRLLVGGDFELGEKVTIRCVAGILRLIERRRVTGHASISISNVSSNGSSTSSSSNGSNGANGSSVIVTSGANGASSNTSESVSTNGQSDATATASASSTGSFGTATSVSAEGPVSSITSTSVSVGDATCPFDQASYPAGSFGAELKPGEVAKIGCTTSPAGAQSTTLSAP